MHDLGIENFWYEIIETTENYDEREAYWIAYYDCMLPKGYNKLSGGDGAQPGVKSANAKIRDQSIVDAIMNDLSFSNLKLIEIANKYNVDSKIISAINRGIVYKDKTRFYPLRERCADAIDKLDYQNLIDDLINTKISYRELEKKYNTSTYIIKQVNLGKKFFNEELNYPLRTKEVNSAIFKVKEMLENTNLSMHEIGRQCNISYSMVAQINYGKYHNDSWRQYPIRKQQ